MIDISEYSRYIRIRSIELCNRKRTSHIGGALSVADILAVLYGDTLSVTAESPEDPNRDLLFYSKGHACTALYSALEFRGFLKDYDLLNDFTKDGSYFTSHINHYLPGVELSTGSLGHALGVACGSALACRLKNKQNTVFAILSDGELDEGSNWEAILFAAHNKLDNLIAVIDYNKYQSFGSVSDVMGLEPLADKFRSFNWDVEEVDGHSISELREVLKQKKIKHAGHPKCVIAHTVKGKGVSFMENKLAWHYRSPSDEDVLAAHAELNLI